jgi:TM2 domain protein
MTTPDPQATPFNPEDPAKVTVPEAPSADFSIPDAPAVEAAAEIPTPEVPTFEPAAEIPAPAAPSFPQASAPSFDEATATPGSTTYGTAYDAASAQPGPDAAANQAPYGAQPGFAQPGFEQAAYAAGQQAYGQPGYSQPAYGQPVVAGPPKQWIVALLLGLFFGGFGVHNFYLGYTNRAIIQLILTIIVIGAPVTAVWVLIELVMILMRSGSYGYDAQGQPLQ